MRQSHGGELPTSLQADIVCETGRGSDELGKIGSSILFAETQSGGHWCVAEHARPPLRDRGTAVMA